MLENLANTIKQNDISNDYFLQTILVGYPAITNGSIQYYNVAISYSIYAKFYTIKLDFHSMVDNKLLHTEYETYNPEVSTVSKFSGRYVYFESNSINTIKETIVGKYGRCMLNSIITALRFRAQNLHDICILFTSSGIQGTVHTLKDNFLEVINHTNIHSTSNSIVMVIFNPISNFHLYKPFNTDINIVICNNTLNIPTSLGRNMYNNTIYPMINIPNSKYPLLRTSVDYIHNKYLSKAYEQTYTIHLDLLHTGAQRGILQLEELKKDINIFFDKTNGDHDDTYVKMLMASGFNFTEDELKGINDPNTPTLDLFDTLEHLINSIESIVMHNELYVQYLASSMYRHSVMASQNSYNP